MHPPHLDFSSHISPDLRIRHILLSYPLSVLWIVTCFHSTPFTKALQNLVTHPKSDVLILYGENDQFTKAAKYEGWVKTLETAAAKVGCGRRTGGTGKVAVQTLQNGDHFWQGPIMRDLRKSIAEWLGHRPSVPFDSPAHKTR